MVRSPYRSIHCWQPWLQHANYSEVVCSLTAMRPPPTTSSCYRASLGDVVCFPVSLHKLTNPIRRRHKIPFTTWTQRVRTGPIYDPHLQKLNSDPLLSHSVSWLCRTLSSTSLKSISRDPLWRSECCSSRCYLWVSSVQSNTTLVTEITTMSSSSTDSLHHPCGRVLFVWMICQVEWTECGLINRLIYWAVFPDGSV